MHKIWLPVQTDPFMTMPTSWGLLDVQALKNECGKHGLSKSGLKADLVTRLTLWEWETAIRPMTSPALPPPSAPPAEEGVVDQAMSSPSPI
eukprot:12402891-Karenia_brevis.AAC.1